MGFPIGVYWFPYWDNGVSIGIEVSPNQHSIVDMDPRASVSLWRGGGGGTSPNWPPQNPTPKTPLHKHRHSMRLMLVTE